MSRLAPTLCPVTRDVAIKAKPITGFLKGMVTGVERIWSEMDLLQILSGDRQVAAKVTFSLPINLQPAAEAECQ